MKVLVPSHQQVDGFRFPEKPVPGIKELAPSPSAS